MSRSPWTTTVVIVGFAVSCGDDPKPSNPSAPTQPPQPESYHYSGGTVSSGVVDLDRAAPAIENKVASGAACPGCDVVLVTVCSLRRDHVGLYGETSGLTPNIDAFTGDAFRFDQAYSASNFTLASLAAVLTGRFGSTTGVMGWDKGLAREVLTLPEVLGFYGYATGGFTIDAPSGFRPDYGLDEGFSRMVVIQPPRDTPDGRLRGGEIGAGGASAQPVVDWIAQQPADQPIFAMFHSRTAHFPFVVEEPSADDDPTGVLRALWGEGSDHYDAHKTKAMPGMAGGTDQKGVVMIREDPVEAQVRKAGAAGVTAWRAAYAESVRWMDKDIGRLVTALEARGRLDKTLFVLVADHGESLDEHGELLHGVLHYDGVVRVPLLIRVPGTAGRTVESLVSQVDIAPTILELVGAVPPAGIDGRSLVPLLDGTSNRIRATALVEGNVLAETGDKISGAVISPPWVLLRQRRRCDGVEITEPGVAVDAGWKYCLFDVSADPEQQRDVAAAHPDVVQQLTQRWDGFRQARSGGAVPDQLRLDPEFVEMLQKTGYDFRPSTP